MNKIGKNGVSNLFVFFSLLAASIDRFVSGFIVSSLAVKFKIKEFILSFVIIFLCCLVASAAGNYLSYTDISKYSRILINLTLWDYLVETKKWYIASKE